MENQAMAEIRHYLLIDAPPDKVYEAVTTQAGLAAWWTGQTVARPAVDAVIEFRFGERYYNKMRVTALEESHRVEWECLEGDEQWVGTTFVFDLEDREGQTVLRFTHGQWREATDFFASCNYHWGYYLRSLKLYCETGTGTPFREE
jgi:uncharacterized protein YndB with AHSA1/START domain